MNYRHAFHAGNFADVVKHAVLTRLLVHLCSKPAAYRAIDTHAGAGLYDLAGPEAARSGEWHGGIERLSGAPIGDDLRALLAPYLDAVAACNPPGRLTTYPGSPALVRAFLRPQDRLVACELEPNAAAALERNFAHDRRIKAIAIDGWTALNAYVPPKERRGLVLIDPPFEEGARFLASRRKASKAPTANGRAESTSCGTRSRRASSRTRWRDACAAPASARSCAPRSASPRSPQSESRLSGCGLIVVNPPWRLEQELQIMLPGLAAILAGADQGGSRLERISGEL